MHRALVLLVIVACSKSDPPAPPPPSASASAATNSEPPVVFDPTMKSFPCGKIRCNIDYYCVERKRGEPSAVCTSRPPGPKREGCTKVATRTFTCETFP